MMLTGGEPSAQTKSVSCTGEAGERKVQKRPVCFLRPGSISRFSAKEVTAEKDDKKRRFMEEELKVTGCVCGFSFDDSEKSD